MNSRFRNGWIALPLALLSGCATIASPPMLAQPGGAYQVADLEFRGSKILILPPILRYRDVQGERELSATEQPNKALFEELIASYAQTALSQRGFETLTEQKLAQAQSEETRGVLKELAGTAETLLKSWSKDRDARLKQLGFLKDRHAVDGVLVQVLELKLGQSASWDFVATGAVFAGTSSSNLKVALVDTAQGDLAWERESFYRDMADSENLHKMLTVVFQGFPGRIGEDQTS